MFLKGVAFNPREAAVLFWSSAFEKISEFVPFLAKSSADCSEDFEVLISLPSHCLVCLKLPELIAFRLL